MATSLQQMLLRSQNNDSSGGTTLLTAYEAEQLIEQLHVTPIEQVGSAKFMKQHDAIQKLNLQAHYNAQTHSDEFVLELLLSLDKLTVLVQELLVIEAWKDHLYPLLKQHLAGHVDSATSYIVLYHEAAVANLLEVLLFHRHACEALSEDALLELADWAVRKLAHLNSGAAQKYAHAPERSVQEVLEQTAAAELDDKRAETDFTAALCGLTILRYLSDHLPALPLGLMSRLLSTHDAVMALLPLVESPPWVRNRKGGKVEKFIDGRWQAVSASARLQLTQLDGQVWLALVNLLVEPACRTKYDPDEYRRGCILKLQRHMHELLLDQLPVLRQLARVLDEMALGVNSAAAAGGGASSRLILEQVPMLREAILHNKNWPDIAQRQRTAQFGPAAKQLAQERLQSMLESFEMMCQMEQQQQQSKQTAGCSASGGAAAAAAAVGLLDGAGADESAVVAAPVKVVCSRQVNAGGMWEHWCEFTASIDSSRPAEQVEISSEHAADASAVAGVNSSKSTSSSRSGSRNNAGAVAAHGRRYRLAAMDAASTRALPTKGKVAVHFMGSVAEALLQLPEVPLRSPASVADVAAVPAGLWLTVGLLAADGFALQLRLKKADRPTERDRSQGSWYAYQPVGGAITVLLPPQPATGAGGTPKTAAAPASSGATAAAAATVAKAAAAGGGTTADSSSRDTVLLRP